MVCVQCGSETRVTNSRFQKRLNQVWRRRQCLSCLALFSTEESPQYAGVWAVKSSSGVSSFSRDKLFISIYNSCQHRNNALTEASALTDTVIKGLGPFIKTGLIESSHIKQMVLVALNRFDKVSGTHYQAFHPL